MDDPFKKVKKMIKELIVRLMEEANEEAEHKGWCDTELSTNEQTRKEKTEAVETLHAEIDQLEASIAKLTEDIAELTKAIAELDAAMAKATKLRAEEKAKNTETIKDSEEAQVAVAQALTVLKEFYAKAGEATAFLQQEPPEIFEKPYKGMQAENGGVVGMLEVIESDFARLESDTKAAEATAQKEYDEFMTDSKVDKAQKTTDVEHKTAKKQDEEQALTVKKEDLEGTQKELDAALAYFDKLKPSCVDAGVSYEDRVARRKEEIESLQEALRILNGEDIA
jgi:septal ring factor EnvC (AmiA/AmiB activator)